MKSNFLFCMCYLLTDNKKKRCHVGDSALSTCYNIVIRN
jgi:hypothetical protein